MFSFILAVLCGLSIIPCLILRGVPHAIARSPSLKYKILLLNSKHDRETHRMTGIGFVKYVA